MNRKITKFRYLMHLVALDETDHPMKKIATLFVSALRDWPDDMPDISTSIETFKKGCLKSDSTKLLKF